ncbi:MAG: maltose alpha-D-glucosyltransferase [Bacteroidota bacterium]
MAKKTYTRAPLWYKDAIIYELNIKGFMDSDGDGIGDFKGLMSKLDYLESLGITAIWVLPFYPSPLRDDGYDIADYYTINPSFGTLEDFKTFLDEAHKRNLKVITELVINHTSDQHPWFQRARRAPKGSVERDFYVWNEDEDKYKDVRIIFQDFEPSNWTWDPLANAYYWHRFYSHQPDLNYDNPAVQEEIFKVLDYWVDMGIDGFRLDAIPYLFEREGTNCENLPETHVFLKKLRAHMDENFDNVLFLAEANMWPEDSASYFGDGDECHMNYHFPLMPRMYMSLKMEDRHPITDIFEQTPAIPADCQWAMFLRNHDELTLEMVTDEERDYMRKNYAADPKARINLGIRRRLAPLLENDRNRIELLNVLLFSLPGTPVLYYGDEIGMGDNYYLGDRDGVRTPMQWSANKNAGFSDANPQSLYLPVIIDPEYDYTYINVERQQRNTNSLLWWTKRIMATRQRYKVFGRGSIKFLTPANGKILAFIREYEEEVILVVINLSRFVEGVHLDLPDYKNYTPIEIFGDSEFPTISDVPYFLTLAPHGYYWFELQPTETLELTEKQLKSPLLVAETFQELFKEKAFTDKVLPAFFRRVNWFGNKGRKIESVQVVDRIFLELQEQSYAVLMVEVNFRTGFSELFQIPITFKAVSDLSDILLKDEVISTANTCLPDDCKKGVLLDAFYDEGFRSAIVNNVSVLAQSGVLSLETWTDLPEMTESSIRKSTVQYVSVEYKEGYFVKFYRRIDQQPNPDFELMHWLTRQRDIPYVPALLASIFYKDKRNYNTTLATIQPLIAHQGYAWDYVNDHLKRLIEHVEVNARKQTIPTAEVSMFEAAATHKEWAPIFQSSNLQDFLERIRLIAQRTAHMHLELTNSKGVGDSSFRPELFSLHYQRSLFSALNSLVRVSMKTLRENLHVLTEEHREQGRKVLTAQPKILDYFQRIYVHKFEATKIRIHGNFHLEQIMMVGDDIQIDDFDGTFDRPFSERKLRKSPLIDVATLLRSMHYAILNAEAQNQEVKDISLILKYWYKNASGTFLQAYRKEIADANIAEFIPEDEGDFRILMEVFMLERALKELLYEFNYRPEMAHVPIKGILDMIGVN